jgi:glycosyltransferase involved in cell wall biosynthesis
VAVSSSAPAVLLVSAYGPDARRGNASTCRRYRDAGLAAGFSVEWVFGEGEALVRNVAAATRRLRPALLHGHHALRTGPALAATGVPYVLSEGGTEFELLARDPSADAVWRDVCARAVLVLCATEASAAEWAARGAAPASRIRMLPRAVATLPPAVRVDDGPLRRAIGVAREAFVVLVVAGLRPGKDPLRAVEIFSHVRSARPDAALVLLGLDLDPAVAAAVRARAETTPGVFVLGTFPPEEMPAAMADADVVLNTSRYEGLSNALLEAQAVGRPVVAAAIPANAAAVPPEDPRALFGDDATAVAALLDYARDPRLRAEAGARSRVFVRERFSAAREAAALVSAWRAALAAI